MGALYQELLSELEGFQLPLAATEYAENIYWVFGLLASSEALKTQTLARLQAAQIGTRPFFWPMHEQPVFQKRGLFAGESYPVAEQLARRGFYVPSGLGLEEAEISIVAETLKHA